MNGERVFREYCMESEAYMYCTNVCIEEKSKQAAIYYLLFFLELFGTIIAFSSFKNFTDSYTALFL